MNRVFKETLSQGKTGKTNPIVERFINVCVLLGFSFMVFWIVFLFPRVFIHIQVVLSILFLSGLTVTPFLYKKIISELGYQLWIEKKYIYNFLIIFLTYLLITIAIGNFCVSIFLASNTIFKEDKIQTIYLKPKNIEYSYSRKNNSRYSHLEVEFDGVSKRINFGDTQLKDLYNKKLKIDMKKGFLGYYVIIKRRLI